MGPPLVEASAAANGTLKAAATAGGPDLCVQADERCAGLGADVCDSCASEISSDTLER